MTESLLQLKQVAVRLDGVPIVHEVSFSLAAGEVLALIGPSGCGKTTTLRAIAGLETDVDGVLRYGGADLLPLAPAKRNIGYLFQEGALFPHLNVAGNIGFGLRHQAKAERTQRIAQLLQLVQLPGFQTRPIHALSGGQRQRIALARALARAPKLLLLDEPFSSLDVALRVELREALFTVLETTGTAAVLVTHDPKEADSVASRVGVMSEGRLSI